mmetsp:Transcript_17849/g.24696  ORF Transcript_17849/g.24696 Transcript_17849/m.24696 type:complete len:317 (+) Transcript_17849:40-990(+)|eukprot:CAMPEP_0196583282 /NCGR_PEP_ID=MMETSP1081-20130531/42834_1 /TAXON_ID=36882 /ORGANISM="Pyramimonas amylifera, Strain CCMP720" /LENGTH=316 /DNA_ID=CAMNT_0041904115 /DNA_START=161 /DNA_END=1111 /DNA_ORIENTATION=+
MNCATLKTNGFAALASRSSCYEEKSWQNYTTTSRESLVPATSLLNRNKYNLIAEKKPFKALLKRQIRSSRASRSIQAAAISGQDVDVSTGPSSQVIEILLKAEAVCFDVDSTVCTDEGIDELAAFLGAGDEVAAWTRRAMGGGVPFQDALQARLDIMNPSREQVTAFLSAHPPLLSPGIRELIAALQAKGKHVYLVSGGFRQMIGPVADLIGVPRSNIYANNLLFSESGDFAGFDPAEFTSQAGGKAKAIQFLKKDKGYKTMVMMGDGATDLEAKMPGGADMFIGYGGVTVRSNVEEAADWYVTSFDPLIKVVTRQ